MMSSILRALGNEEGTASTHDDSNVAKAPVTDDSQPPSDGLPGRYGASRSLFVSSTKILAELDQMDSKANSVLIRKVLPAPAPERSVNIWSFLKTCIGKELTKISMPVSFNEPISLLQRITENMEYAALLEVATLQHHSSSDADDAALTRMLFVAAFQVAGNAAASGRYNKPFNPVLGETYELVRPELCYRWVTEQVSHHPPVSAFHGENEHWEFHGSTQPKLKFWGKSIEVKPIGVSTVRLKKFNETYTWTPCNVLVHNIVVGKLWSEFCGNVTITCHESGYKAILTYKPSSSPTGKDFGRFEGVVENKQGEKKKILFGKWTQYVCAGDFDKAKSDDKHHSKSSFSFHNTNKRASSVNTDRSQQHSESQLPTRKSDGSRFKLHAALTIDVPDGAAATMQSTVRKNPNGAPANDPAANGSLEQSDAETTRKTVAAAELAEYAGAVVLDACDEQHVSSGNAVLLWASKPKPAYCAKYYNMTEFAMGLNAMPTDAAVLPRSDCRFRSDMRCLEEANVERAAVEKDRIENKQRAQRQAAEKAGNEWQPLWFDLRQHPTLTSSSSAEQRVWMPKGTYWNRDYGAVPDLFS